MLVLRFSFQEEMLRERNKCGIISRICMYTVTNDGKRVRKTGGSTGYTLMPFGRQKSGDIIDYPGHWWVMSRDMSQLLGICACLPSGYNERDTEEVFGGHCRENNARG